MNYEFDVEIGLEAVSSNKFIIDSYGPEIQEYWRKLFRALANNGVTQVEDSDYLMQFDLGATLRRKELRVYAVYLVSRVGKPIHYHVFHVTHVTDIDGLNKKHLRLFTVK